MNKILLTVDGSENSIKASEEAVKLAKSLNAEVTLFSVVQDDPIHCTPIGIPLSEFNKMREKNLQYQFSSFETLLKLMAEKYAEAGISVAAKIKKGRPADEIIKEVNDGSYSLVVLGSRGLSRIWKLLLGTVSGKVAKNVKCSVFIVR